MYTPTAQMNHSMWYLLTSSDPSVWHTCHTFALLSRFSQWFLRLIYSELAFVKYSMVISNDYGRFENLH